MDKTKFGAFVAENRKKLALTQKELAERLHVTDKAVSKWERGLSYPDVTLLEPLADAFGMGVTELVSCRSEAPSPAPAERADWEIPPTEERGEEAAVQTLLDISGESLHTERKRGRRRTVLLSVLAVLLLAALAVTGALLLGKNETTESDQIRVLHTEGTEADLTLFTEKEGHLLRLRCAPEADPAALLELVSFGDPIFAEYRWDRRTWSGTLLSFRQVTSGMAIGGPMDEAGSAFVLFDGDGELFGFSRVVEEIHTRQRNPDGKGYLSTYIFYKGDESDDWYMHADEALVRVRDCLGYSTYGDHGCRILDFDGDGVNELLARTLWPEKPCIVYDLENGVLTETWLDEMPEEMTGPTE
jgi:transcriptional regulator with XRE-family HTH domain